MAQRARERIRSLLHHVEVPAARAFKALGFTPNSITVLGFGIAILGAVLVGMGHLRAGGAVFLGGGALDLVDGALARLTHRVTPFGALLDSLLDRLGEAALLLGLAIYALRVDPDSRNLIVYMTLLILALVSSQSVSYLRARGESLGIDTREGLVTRPERVVVLSLGLILGVTELALGLVAFFSLWTLLTRLFLIWRNLKAG